MSTHSMFTLWIMEGFFFKDMNGKRITFAQPPIQYQTGQAVYTWQLLWMIFTCTQDKLYSENVAILLKND